MFATVPRSLIRTLALLAMGAALVASMLILSGRAHAYTGQHLIETDLQWAGPECISYNDNDGYTKQICSATRMATGRVYSPSGLDIGNDPIMGSASWISCQVFVDGALAFTDFAAAGDGTDVNCTRHLNY